MPRFKDEKRPFHRFRVQNVGFVGMGVLEACFKRPRNTVGAAENQLDALFASAKWPFSGKREFQSIASNHFQAAVYVFHEHAELVHDITACACKGVVPLQPPHISLSAN